MTLQPTANDTWDTFTWKLFRVFLMRHSGWTADQVAYEINLLKGLNWSTKSREVDLKNSYFPASRAGTDKRINRNARRGVMFTYQAACNHASIHFDPSITI